jgi:stage III sporulation protein SpoIIIAA
MSLEITDNIDALIAALPAAIAQKLHEVNRFGDLLEVVLDLGRVPEARYVDAEIVLSPREITQQELDEVVANIGSFGDDNRAGIERTLHRISAIRNRGGRVIGLTCRVGRAVEGTVDIIGDMVESGKSILLLGRPGVGKTTMLREVARILAVTRRVVIVDTSNEIGGDGDIPHPAIGRARRMQVVTPPMQHAVMIEAVENHMPEVIVIDEIGTELEAAAARTIAERGVQLVGTAHGNTLDNLMMNPTLCDLVGGIQTVTLSDEEARRRGTQKSVLERKAPPTFDVVVEIQDWDRMAVRHDVASDVDEILRGKQPPAEVRVRRDDGAIDRFEQPIEPEERTRRQVHGERAERWDDADDERPMAPARRSGLSTLKVYPYGLNQSRFRQTARRLNLPILLVDDIHQADALFTLRTYYRKAPHAVIEAQRRGVPVYVLRNNTEVQMEAYLADIFGLSQVDGGSPDRDGPFSSLAEEEARQAILRIANGQRNAVPLAPQSATVRRRQHQLAREANLLSRSSGKEPRRRVTIYQSA